MTQSVEVSEAEVRKVEAEMEDGLFDGKQFEIPFPKADGKEVTDLVLRLSGNQKLSRNDPEHVALIESLSLGRIVSLNVIAEVGGKGTDFKNNEDGSESVTHSVALKLHEVVPESSYVEQESDL